MSHPNPLETSPLLKCGLIGLGAMGAPMARNLAKKGFLTALWNRTGTRSADLGAELGAACASSPAALAAQVDVIFLCVSADADVLAVIDGLIPGLRPGSLVVDHSTVSRETAVEAGRRVGAVGADFLDAPVTGGVEGARQGTLAIMVGGAAEVLERVRPVLQALGSRIVHMGGIGSGQAAKAVNQVMAAGINEAVTEALGLGDHLGLPMDKLIEVVSGGAAGNWFLEKRGPPMTRGRFEAGFRVALHRKDLAICKAMAESVGVRLELVETALEHYAELIDRGYGDEDISALYRLKRPEA